MRARRFIAHGLTSAMLMAFTALLAVMACALPAHAAELADATRVVDPSTANDYGSILGEGDPNTLNTGRVWADKSVYDGDATLDGVTVTNDGDFLVVFSALGSSIAKDGPGYDGAPTSPIAGEDDTLTFTDPLGQYMEPTGDVTLVQFGQSYRFTRTGTTEDAMTFSPVADQTIVNQSYGTANVSFSLSDISIAASRDAQANRWTMSVRVPANALPLNVATVLFGAPDPQGNRRPIRFSSNAGSAAALPLRLAYSIGIGNDVRDASGALDFSKVPTDYQEGHLVTTGDGTALSFTGNRYDDPTVAISPASTRGNATVDFAPAPTNSFYYFQERHTIYRNGTAGTFLGNPVLAGNVSSPVTDLYELQGNPKRSFFVVREYYRRTGTGGAQVAYEVIAHTGDELLQSVGYYDPRTQTDATQPGTGIIVATKVGGACLGNLKAFRTAKTANPTNTAALSYVGSYIPDASAYGGYTLRAYYGNNGLLTVPYTASDSLDVTGTKRFDINGGVWAPGIADFHAMRFDVLPSRANPAGDPVTDAGFSVASNASGEINLVLGTYARPGTYSYVVRERMPASPSAGMSYDSSTFTIVVEARAGQSGKIETKVALLKNGSVLAPGQGIEFVNTYDTAAIGVNVQGTKQLDGAALAAGAFSFSIEGVRGTGVGADGTVGPIPCPLPSETVTTCDAAGAFSFGTIMFAQAGEYVYRVTELAPLASARPADYVYDGTQYLVTVTVRHTGTGPLRAEMTIAKLDDDGAPLAADAIAFRNTVVPPALVVTKTQGANGSSGEAVLDVRAGDTITYRIELRNPTGITAYDVLLSDEVPAGLLLPIALDADADGPYLHEGRLYWIIRELAGGASFVATFSVIVPAAPAETTWRNLAQATYPSPLDASQVLTAQSGATTARFVSEPQPGPEPEPGPSPEPEPKPTPAPEPEPTPVPAPDAVEGAMPGRGDAADVQDSGSTATNQTSTKDTAMTWPLALIALSSLVGAVAFSRLRRRPSRLERP